MSGVLLPSLHLSLLSPSLPLYNILCACRWWSQPLLHSSRHTHTQSCERPKGGRLRGRQPSHREGEQCHWRWHRYCYCGPSLPPPFSPLPSHLPSSLLPSFTYIIYLPFPSHSLFLLHPIYAHYFSFIVITRQRRKALSRHSRLVQKCHLLLSQGCIYGGGEMFPLLPAWNSLETRPLILMCCLPSLYLRWPTLHARAASSQSTSARWC